MIRYLKLYRAILSLSISRSLIYQQEFITWTIVDTVWGIINIGFFRILLYAIPDLSGWTFTTLAIPLGILYFLNAIIWGFLWPNLSRLPQMINRGELDLYLTKPVNSQFLVSTGFIGLNLIPSVAAGVFLTWYGFKLNHLPPSAILIIPLAVISSSVISYAIWFMTVSLAFWFNRLLNIHHVFPNAAEVARYPVTIFHPAIQFLFTYILPFALLGFLPAEVILGRKSSSFLLLPIVLSAILLYLSHLFWNISLRRYQSASS